jgi:hypothetical protein
MKMDRREAIQRAALIMGYAITGPALVFSMVANPALN